MLHLRAPDAPASSAEPPAAPEGGPSGFLARAWLFRAAVALALLPVLVATARALARGWLPVGDNAYFAIRARDVLTEHHPLLGTWTSASISAGTNFNNPGPLLFDAFAVPAKLVGGGAGVAVGAALLNCLAIVGIAVAARRRGGPVLGVWAMVVTAGLSWTMGSELLFDPWQPHSLLLPSLLLLFLAWSLASGDVAALPWAVGVASLVVQTHLSYAVIVAALGAWAAAGLVVSLRRRRTEVADRLALRRRTRRSLAVAAVVLALSWAQPVVEQLGGEGTGNLTRLASNAGSSPETVGPELGTRLVARVVALPPWWLRPSFERALLPAEDGVEAVREGIRLPRLPSAAGAVASLAGLGLVLLGCAVLAGRRRDRTGLAAAGTATVGLLSGLVTAASLPLGFVGIAPHQFRWLWPLAAFTTFAIVACLVGAAAVAAGRRATAATALGTLVVLVLAAATLPTYNVGSGPADDDWAIPVVRELSAGMEALEGEGPLLIDMRGIRFAEPYSGPVMAELQRRGIPFVVDDEGMVRQLGPSRRAGADAQRLVIREGDATQVVPAGERRAVLVEGLDPREQAELDDLEAAVLDHLVAVGEVPLNERGRAALARGDLPAAAARPEALTTAPEALLGGRELVFMVERDLLDLEEGEEALFERYATLQRAWDLETVALFLAPRERDRVAG